jgi:hypothetical protein
MKIRIISSREEINSIRPNEKAVHLAFRASNVDFLNLLKKVPRLQMVQVPPSYMRTISKAIEVFLDMQGVKLLEGDVWGHRKDIDEYFTVADIDDERARIKICVRQTIKNRCAERLTPCAIPCSNAGCWFATGEHQKVASGSLDTVGPRKPIRGTCFRIAFQNATASGMECGRYD